MYPVRNKAQTGLMFTVWAMALMLFLALSLDTAIASGHKKSEHQSDGGYNSEHQSGYTGPTVDPMTVVQAKQLNDDAPVTLEGKLIKSLGGEHYIFKDSTGEINVDVDDDAWRGQQVGPNDIITIYGDVDKEDHGDVKIDVENIIKH